MVLKFIQFKSVIDQTFWHKLAETKLDIDRLNEGERGINGFYTNYENTGAFLELDYTAFSRSTTKPKYHHLCKGTLINKNTIENFKNVNKQALLDDYGEKLLEKMIQPNFDPNDLTLFLLLTYADLKKFNFYYWCCFPAPLNWVIEQHQSPTKVLEQWYKEKYEQFVEICMCTDEKFFLIHETQEQLKYEKINARIEVVENVYCCFRDSSPFDEPGWVLRNYLLYLAKARSELCCQQWIKVICVKVKKGDDLTSSKIWKLKLPNVRDNIKWTGWEKNSHGSLGPQMVAMEDSMDPIQLSKSSLNLNLKLMKWRLVPDLDLKQMENVKCLLVGAGTLGCGVARSLLAWGINNFTFIDSGVVRYSNTVRQSLYTFNDALTCKKKVVAAVERIKEINPNANVSGFDLHIPMPQHPISEKLKERLDDLNLFENLVKDHDVLFLLTDSRESRWLPTMFGAFYKKIVINAALGFDSYLVMRHGINSETLADSKENLLDDLTCIVGNDLGCYFCNDITAPGDSQTDRTLDQQCTVSRPAVSNIASSLAVELLVALLQHPKKAIAPAFVLKQNTNSSLPEGILGVLPHSIRGHLSNFSQILPATEKFKHCTACSNKILEEYESKGQEFLLQVFQSSSHLEKVSGLDDLLKSVNIFEDYDMPEEIE